MKLGIIGGGLTGLTTALVLKNLNLDIDIFLSEKKTTKKIDERSIIDRIKVDFLDNKILPNKLTLKDNTIAELNSFEKEYDIMHANNQGDSISSSFCPGSSNLVLRYQQLVNFLSTYSLPSEDI